MPDIRCQEIDCTVLRDKVKNGLSSQEIQALGGPGSPRVAATEQKLRDLLLACCAIEGVTPPPPPPPPPVGPGVTVAAAGGLAIPMPWWMRIGQALAGLSAQELLAMTAWGLVVVFGGAMAWDLIHRGMPRWHGCDLWSETNKECIYLCPDGNLYYIKRPSHRGCKKMEQFLY